MNRKGIYSGKKITCCVVCPHAWRLERETVPRIFQHWNEDERLLTAFYKREGEIFPKTAIELLTMEFFFFTKGTAGPFHISKKPLSYWRWNFFFFTPWETRRGRKKNGSSPCQKMGKQRKRLCGRIAACRDDGERCKARDLILNRVGATFGFVNVTCGTRGWGSFLLRKLFPSSSSPNSSNRIKGKHPFLKKKLNENQIT